MTLSEDRVDEAARTLAIESRALLGLPTAPSGSNWVQCLPSPPTALEFSRIVCRHVPVLIEKCLDDRTCTQRWRSSSYLIKKLQTRKLEVTFTPDGRADDVHTSPKGKDVFVLPMTIEMCVKISSCCPT